MHYSLYLPIQMPLRIRDAAQDPVTLQSFWLRRLHYFTQLTLPSVLAQVHNKCHLSVILPNDVPAHVFEQFKSAVEDHTHVNVSQIDSPSGLNLRQACAFAWDALNLDSDFVAMHCRLPQDCILGQGFVTTMRDFGRRMQSREMLSFPLQHYVGQLEDGTLGVIEDYDARREPGLTIRQDVGEPLTDPYKATGIDLMRFRTTWSAKLPIGIMHAVDNFAEGSKGTWALFNREVGKEKELCAKRDFGCVIDREVPALRAEGILNALETVPRENFAIAAQ